MKEYKANYSIIFKAEDFKDATIINIDIKKTIADILEHDNYIEDDSDVECKGLVEIYDGDVLNDRHYS